MYMSGQNVECRDFRAVGCGRDRAFLVNGVGVVGEGGSGQQ
jgi:hypothetical protein